jgi:phage gpG-like protein
MLGGLSYQVEGNSVRVGFNQKYAWYHELGNFNMARRGLLTSDPISGTLGEGDENAILDVLRNALQNAVDG